MYVRIFSPDGEPFEVSRERANNLILNEGWTQTAPTITIPVALVKPVQTKIDAVKSPREEISYRKTRTVQAD